MNPSGARALLAIAICCASASPASAFDLAATVEACAACHGKDGATAEPNVPNIGGYSGQYVSESLMAYQKQERSCHETTFPAGPHKGEKTDMCQSVKGLSESDADKLGDYFSKRKFVRTSQQVDAALARKGQEIHDANCEKCHLDSGGQASDDAGILAGQKMEYLRVQFGDIKAGKRQVLKKMKPKIDALSPDDVEALVNFYGSIK